MQTCINLQILKYCEEKGTLKIHCPPKKEDNGFKVDLAEVEKGARV